MADDYDLTAALVAHIKATCPGFVYVDEAWFHKPLDDFPQQTPAALVYMADDLAGQLGGMGARQATQTVYGVFIVSAKGSVLRERRKELREALFGWQPNPAGAVMSFHGGGMEDLQGRYAWWKDFWRIDNMLRVSNHP